MVTVLWIVRMICSFGAILVKRTMKYVQLGLDTANAKRRWLLFTVLRIVSVSALLISHTDCCIQKTTKQTKDAEVRPEGLSTVNWMYSAATNRKRATNRKYETGWVQPPYIYLFPNKIKYYYYCFFVIQLYQSKKSLYMTLLYHLGGRVKKKGIPAAT